MPELMWTQYLAGQTEIILPGHDFREQGMDMFIIQDIVFDVDIIY